MMKEKTRLGSAATTNGGLWEGCHHQWWTLQRKPPPMMDSGNVHRLPPPMVDSGEGATTNGGLWNAPHINIQTLNLLPSHSTPNHNPTSHQANSHMHDDGGGAWRGEGRRGWGGLQLVRPHMPTRGNSRAAKPREGRPRACNHHGSL